MPSPPKPLEKDMKTLLIVAHSPSTNTKLLVRSIEEGAKTNTDQPVKVLCQSPFDTNAEDISRAQGLILFTTENFGYMSGAMKDLFDRTYYALIDTKRGLPYALIIRAGKDGTGTQRSVESITLGLGWQKVQEALVLKGDFQPTFTSQVNELAQAFTVGLAEGIF